MFQKHAQYSLQINKHRTGGDIAATSAILVHYIRFITPLFLRKEPCQAYANSEKGREHRMMSEGAE